MDDFCGQEEADAGSWLVTARMAGRGGVREVALDGLAGTASVAALIMRAALALGVSASAEEVALLVDSRLLRGEDTLAAAGVASGDVVYVCCGEEGGMPDQWRDLQDEDQKEAEVMRIALELFFQVIKKRSKACCLICCLVPFTTTYKNGRCCCYGRQ